MTFDHVLTYIRQGLLYLPLLFILVLGACSPSEPFRLKDLAKTDIDQVAEIHLERATDLMKSLTSKLYKKNPQELKKIPNQTIESRILQIFNCSESIGFDELDQKRGADAILLGFDETFSGDRVFAVMVGLYTMILKSYNNQCEFFITDQLDQQALYNCARNIEILVWRLKTKHKADDDLFLLTDSFAKPFPNLSYERIFGKLISLQDTIAVIVSKRTHRVIREVVIIGSMAFLPIGI